MYSRDMNYRAFGNTGIRVSDLILGTWYLPNSGTKTKPQVDGLSFIFCASCERRIGNSGEEDSLIARIQSLSLLVSINCSTMSLVLH